MHSGRYLTFYDTASALRNSEWLRSSGDMTKGLQSSSLPAPCLGAVEQPPSPGRAQPLQWT